MLSHWRILMACPSFLAAVSKGVELQRTIGSQRGLLTRRHAGGGRVAAAPKALARTLNGKCCGAEPEPGDRTISTMTTTDVACFGPIRYSKLHSVRDMLRKRECDVLQFLVASQLLPATEQRTEPNSSSSELDDFLDMTLTKTTGDAPRVQGVMHASPELKPGVESGVEAELSTSSPPRSTMEQVMQHFVQQP
mmetsp:Transcript_81798/g.249912  ORF Transcript_81798/g.249912 Transcript_81798/m.249912 type:complete len:193 (-) Transcript_81798:343-921(-)